MESPFFMKDLLNVLKNERRPHILRMLSGRRYSLGGIQQKLGNEGFKHSQKTLVNEYINPLIHIGLADTDGDQYYATFFGKRLTEINPDLFEAIDALPMHSECYEEVVLTSLMDNPRTYEELEHFVPAPTIARTLSRLQSVNLVETPKGKDYVFYFKSKRDKAKEDLIAAEETIYENIPEEGIAAGKLARKAAMSLRRTYKYLRKLKGKKLVFVRTKRKVFALTASGIEAAGKLERMHHFAMETRFALEQLSRQEQSLSVETHNGRDSRHKKKEQEFVPLMLLQKKAS
jgi:predicted transcriptional regulator/DNA-binding HxlR family transcriptional regulator